MTLYDCIIVGGGPAGLSAAIAARRTGLTVLMLEKDIVGGSPAVMASIENYPGIEKIDGWSFTRIMEKQVISLGAEIRESAEVLSVVPEADGTKTVATASGRKYVVKTVIIASGGEPKKLLVQGEERLARQGVHYCAQCAGPAYKEGTVVVCGNGVRALTAADHLLKLATQVVFVTEYPELQGDAILAAQLSADDRFQLLPHTRVQQIRGASQVEGLELFSHASGATQELAVDAIFIYRGLVPRTAILAAAKDPQGYLRVDAQVQTSIAGVFAAGSVVRSEPHIVIAAGEGARAGLAAAAWVGAYPLAVSD
jgi:thioredoxin reductase (NADPH)